MSPDERAELNEIHETIKNILVTLAAHQRDLDAKAVDLVAKQNDLAAKQQNLDAKAGHLEVLTSFAGGARVLLIALQHAISTDPVRWHSFQSAVAAIRSNYTDHLLFTATPDVSIDEIQAEIDRLLVKQPSPNQPPTQPL